MKIYTEEQVRFITKAILDHDFDPEKTSDELVNELTPIELPKYKEIANASNHCKDIQVKAGFLNGAIWIKEKYLTKTNNL
jgi:hypothetical protein